MSRADRRRSIKQFRMIREHQRSLGPQLTLAAIDEVAAHWSAEEKAQYAAMIARDVLERFHAQRAWKYRVLPMPTVEEWDAFRMAVRPRGAA